MGDTPEREKGVLFFIAVPPLRSLFLSFDKVCASIFFSTDGKSRKGCVKSMPRGCTLFKSLFYLRVFDFEKVLGAGFYDKFC